MGDVAKLPRRKQAACPICGKPGADPYRPFCSKRCADIDLGRWFGGRYRIETEEAPQDGAAEPGKGEAEPER